MSDVATGDLDVRASRYVLGDMDEAERAAFERVLQEDAALAAEVAELRDAASVLERELTRKSGELPRDTRAHIERAAREQGAAPLAAPETRKRRAGRVGRRLAVLGGLALAATIPLVFWTHKRGTAPAVVGKNVALSDGYRYLGAPSASVAMSPPPDDRERASAAAGNKHAHIDENPFFRPADQPLSTFSIDVDTASWAMVRSYLSRGEAPPPGAVRIEEMVNSFGYAYAPPTDGAPFRVSLDLGVAPWAPSHRLVRVALRGMDAKLSSQDGVNLVFLIDTSGSMTEPNKLPLLKKGLAMLAAKLGPNDKVAIVAYAGSAGLVLPPTAARDKDTILQSLDRLEAGGSTNGGAGIELAYKVATEGFVKGGVNRVILATDGDFNVGTTSNDQLVSLIQEKAKTGVFLSVLGFGMGNLNDALLEQIADKGNGMYSYIDNEDEARRALVDGMGSLITIAKDVKIQVEYNPAAVGAYRLLGYENRVMAAQDFNDDKKDAGELGAGHTVTALYEIIPPGQPVPAAPVDALKYQPASPPGSVHPRFAGPRELMTVKLRYKEPAGTESKLLTAVLQDREASLATMDPDFRFAAAVAGFGMVLRGSPHKGDATWASLAALAEGAAGADPKRRELGELIERARGLRSRP